MSIPDLVTPADMLGKSIYADRARKADQINARHRERMTQIIQERDDLKFVLDRQNPWNEKAQELLDAGRWAGHTLIEGCVTELKETRAELGQEVERVAVIEERFVDLDKERDRLEHQLETTRTENELLRAALAEAREENARLREALEKSKEFVQSWGELIDTQYPLWNDCMTTIQQALTPCPPTNSNTPASTGFRTPPATRCRALHMSKCEFFSGAMQNPVAKNLKCR